MQTATPLTFADAADRAVERIRQVDFTAA